MDKRSACLLMLGYSHSTCTSLIQAATPFDSNPEDRKPIYNGEEVMTLRHYKPYWPSSPGLSAQLPPVAALYMTPSVKVRDFHLTFMLGTFVLHPTWVGQFANVALGFASMS